MRGYIYYICALWVVGFAWSCTKDGDTSTPEDQNIGYTTLSLASTVKIGVATAESRATDTFEIPEELIPSAEDLKLTLTGEYTDPEDGIDKEYYGAFANIAAYNTSNNGEAPIMPAGEYLATLSDDSDIDLESQTNSCFGGEISFTLYARDEEAEATVTVALLNSIISLKSTDTFDNYYTSAELIVTTESGTEITFDPKQSDNDERIFFVKPNTKLTLKGSAIKTTGAEVTFAETYIGTTSATTHSQITVDASLVGGLSITYSLDDSVTQLPEENFELNPLINN